MISEMSSLCQPITNEQRRGFRSERKPRNSTGVLLRVTAGYRFSLSHFLLFRFLLLLLPVIIIITTIIS